jgi:hypothetical protein
MKKCRIIERIRLDGRIVYTIQQKHYIFFWEWVDGWLNSWDGAACTDTFNTLEEAQKNLCYFDGSKCKEKVIQ